MRIKKLIVFILVFAAVYGFTAVDQAYSDMMDKEGSVGLSVRRVNPEYITVSMFGKSTAVNTRELSEDWNDFSEAVVDRLETATASIRGALGIEDPERDYSVFQLQML
ncbi:hypothetical protein [Sinanaerobacter chloroacetimidivorans]|jgi:hypothetical protein|uniref:Uncharacterized protein n=1 Tax=Sinanaerobacter chloroacetimidivorans TaxID=2818044 RepID=A0A8J8AZL8_9FIRM|nr:hypothetical protein [Sinanaerobacter chloroacetimidivorans]MBR0596319.1 hypothetical protein [Sinanaerobacter chloroacetimidivorans]